MPPSYVVKMFYVLIASSIAFVVALAIAMRKKWITHREYLVVAPVLVASVAFTIGSFLYKETVPHTRTNMYQIVLNTGMFTVAIGIATFTIWKRRLRDEEEELTRPKPMVTHKKVPSGPPVSASELRKRKKKRV